MDGLSLYPRLLGDAWSALPAVVRTCHTAKPRLVAVGRFTVTHARSWLARFAIAFASMPAAGEDIPLRLEVRAFPDHQLWIRDFDGFSMRTVQLLGEDGHMAEQRGPFELLLKVTAEEGAVVYRPTGLRFGVGRFRVRVPWWIGPRVEARAWSEPGASEMHVHVAIALAVLGTIVTYGGTLKPAE
jgi:hypothetical protein